MKKIILSAVLLVGLGLTQVNAQSLDYGVKAEANVSNFILDDMGNAKSEMREGMSLGGFAKIDFSEYFAIQPELLFHFQNSKMKVNGVKDDFQYWGIEIPLYAVGQMKLPNNERAYIGIGPYGRFGFSAENTTNNINLYKKNGGRDPFMQRWDLGVGAMIGYEFGFGMQINAGYKYGFINALDADSDNSSMNNQLISLGIGYGF